MAELVDEIIELLAPWPTAVSLALELGFDSAKAAATSAQLAVPLVMAGMTHRLDDPAVGDGLVDVLKTVDPSTLPDLGRILAERSYEPAGSDAANLVIGDHHPRVIAALAAESGCEQAHAAAVLAPTMWLTLATIVKRYGIDHDRQSLLGMVGREHQDLLTSGWDQWMSIVDPSPIVVPAPMAAPTLEPPPQIDDRDQIVSAESTYPPPAGRQTRGWNPSGSPVRDQSALEGRRKHSSNRNPFPDAEPALAEGSSARLLTGDDASKAHVETPRQSVPRDGGFMKPDREDERRATIGRTLMTTAAVLVLLVGGLLAWFWYSENRTSGDDVSASGEGGRNSSAESQPDVSVPSTVSIALTLEDALSDSDATANASLQFNSQDGELCYDIETSGVSGEIRGQIGRGALGSEGVPVVELGALTQSMISCVPIEPATITTILAAPESHYLSVFTPDGTTSVRSQLDGMTGPVTPAGLEYVPDGGGAIVILRDGILRFEGEVPDAETADLLISEFAALEDDALEIDLQIVDGAPPPSGRIMVQDQLFESGSAVPGEGQQATLEKLAALFAAKPNWEVVVIGHTDASGDELSNLELSRLRAEAVRDALIELGGDERLIRADGVGSSEPIASNETEEGRQENRRLEFRIEPTGADS